ncbi:hypothetical protein ON010_g17180 [Phytophthora cinnamomi]|nr:hypothetical protein ON010_g17180 [Phytophthora cinnamomi]
MDQPSDDKRIDGQREPSSGRGDRDKFPDDRDGGVRAHHDRPLDEGSWRGDGSVDGRFLPPPHAGSDGQQPVVGGGRVVDAPTNHDKPGDPESPASRAGSSSLSPSHDVGAGYGEVPQNDGKAQ